jgi:hypothetical protein
MIYVCRASNGDYWSNRDGWVTDKASASFFDNPATLDLFLMVNAAEHNPRAERVPGAVGGFYARRAIMDDYDHGDPYGWAMSWLFAICDRITFETESSVPAAWEFRPSPMGPSNDDEFKAEVMQDWCDYQLLYVGEFLHRYIAILKKAGKDY